MTEKTLKVKATSSIWLFATGMMGICIPLVELTGSGILLPLLVALSAAGSTAAVWFSPNEPKRGEIELVQTVRLLEERITNLETIYVSLPEGEPPRPLPKITDR
ncbi:MAG: hypothetical protein ACFB14_07390 [Leptolyngbyaceae cyanobacterium]